MQGCWKTAKAYKFLLFGKKKDIQNSLGLLGLYKVNVNAKHLKVNTKNYENTFFLEYLGKLHVCVIDISK